MTDATMWGTIETAIGYGADTTSTAGIGVRRIRENIDLVCIPNDVGFADCCADPAEVSSMSPAEFRSGNGLCNGDSGSGALDQKSFDAGTWASFGVLSRGGVSADGTTCTGSVYTRFDAWGSLLTLAANQAATAGGYAPPAWAAVTLADGGATAPMTCAAAAAAGAADGATCSMDTDCASNNCISLDETSFVCASACNADGSCGAGFECEGVPAHCLAGAATAPANATGCSVAPLRSRPSRGLPLVGAGIGVLGLVRRRRRAPVPRRPTHRKDSTS
jgi:hypothetical protein